MVCAPVRSIIPSLKLGDYLSVQAHTPCSISHMFLSQKDLKLLGIRRLPKVSFAALHRLFFHSFQFSLTVFDLSTCQHENVDFT